MENKTMPNEAKNGLAKNNEAGTTGEKRRQRSQLKRAMAD